MEPLDAIELVKRHKEDREVGERAEPHRPRPREPCSLDEAGWLSRLLFLWTGRIIALGARKPLEEEDLEEVSNDDRAERVGGGLERAYFADRRSFFWALVRYFRPQYAPLGPILVVQSACKLLQTQALGALLDYFDDGDDAEDADGWWAAGVLLASGVGVMICHHHYFLNSWRMGMRVRVAVSSVLLRKSARLQLGALTQTTTGHAVNIASSDVERFQNLAVFAHFIWLGPLEACFIVYFLWQEVGASCLAGVATLIGLIPVQTYFSRLFARTRQGAAKKGDERVRATSQIIAGARLVKMYAWEAPFQAIVARVRGEEIEYVLRASTLRALNEAITTVVPAVVALATFGVYYASGQMEDGSFTPRTVFTTLALLNLMQFMLSKFIPLAIESLTESVVACSRIQEYLEHPDVPPPPPSDQRLPLGALELRGATAAWEDGGAPTLRDVTLRVRPGELLAVVGAVGAGKTSLLMALLRELPLASGSVASNGVTGFACQESWIQSGTVRENILFGRDMDKERYRRTVAVCALRTDLEQLPEGDRTFIGERGVNLSGGQRARVALARTVYGAPDICLLDDPLSAVDPHVGRHLFTRCICGELGQTTRVLVTHQLQYLESVDRVAIVEGGAVVAEGTYEELLAAGHGGRLHAAAAAAENRGRADSVAGSDTASLLSVATSVPMAAAVAKAAKLDEKDDGEDRPADGATLNVAEHRETGTVALATYKAYVASMSSRWCGPLLLLLLTLAQTLYAAHTYWLSRWSSQSVADQEDASNIVGYAVIAALLGLAAAARSVYMFYSCVGASQRLHDDMFACVVRAPMLFFDSNPMGRVLNRFAKDIGLMDDRLPLVISDFWTSTFIVIGGVAVVCVVSPFALLIVLPLLFVFKSMRDQYLAASREVRRLEAVSRSPMFAHLSETLNGLTTIRGFGAAPRFVSEFDRKVDDNSRAYFAYLSTSRWLGLRLDTLCLVLLAAAAFGSLALQNSLDVDPGLLGMSLSSVIQLAGVFQWAVRMSAEAENQFVSVERVMTYTKLDSEAAPTSDHPPAADWPQRGGIEIRDLSVAYSPQMPLVLKGVSVSIAPGHNVGVVGRTGSGKSSLVSALFRLMEPRAGSLTIDGVDVLSIGLQELRSKLSVIPQSPFLFSGTMRDNLDPFGQHGDEALWDALRHVQLAAHVRALPGELAFEVAEDGGNFSVGQRQLLCLARAILRHNRILVMDEATANVDLTTERLIQEAVRERFADDTVIMVAHRLDTVIDCDAILVLDDGRVMEYGPPGELLAEGGMFSEMVDELSEEKAAEMRRVASQGLLRSS